MLVGGTFVEVSSAKKDSRTGEHPVLGTSGRIPSVATNASASASSMVISPTLSDGHFYAWRGFKKGGYGSHVKPAAPCLPPAGHAF
mmetsp:Transcript_73803/g.137922  ORF Transcript_73803/g.137922 Transcript_73803/m.137922 type:complete len:86 (+) Transcript_73803:405-662(+)